MLRETKLKEELKNNLEFHFLAHSWRFNCNCEKNVLLENTSKVKVILEIKLKPQTQN